MKIHPPILLDGVTFIGAILNIVPGNRQRIRIELVGLIIILKTAVELLANRIDI